MAKSALWVCQGVPMTQGQRYGLTRGMISLVKALELNPRIYGGVFRVFHVMIYMMAEGITR